MMTDKENILAEEMASLMENISKHVEPLRGKTRIPQLELEMIVSKAKSLHEKAVILAYLHADVNEDNETQGKVQEAAQETMDEPEATEQLQDPQLIDGAAEEGPQEKEETVNQEELIMREQVSGKLNLAAIQPPSPSDETTANSTSVSEPEEPNSVDIGSLENDMKSLGASAPSLNERLAGTRPRQTVGEKLQKVAVRNIAEAIGVNERFQFIEELFGGSTKAYNTSITHLNSVATIEEARSYIESHGWEEKEAAKAFEELVERRFTN